MTTSTDTRSLVCARALRYHDCPMGHDWVGDDPRSSVPFHKSLQAHEDALRWAMEQDTDPSRHTFTLTRDRSLITPVLVCAVCGHPRSAH